MTSPAASAAHRLLDRADPAVAALARRDLRGAAPPHDAAFGSFVVRGLLDGLTSDTSLRRPYAKWAGAHWRLVSLVKLGVPAGHPAAVTAAEAVLGYWTRSQRFSRITVVAGRARRCASQEGNAVAVARRLGLSGDARVAVLVDYLVDWQWPDGGWNCDPRPEAHRSSFHETLPALWGLHEFAAATGESRCRESVQAAAELLLEHDVVFSRRTGAPAHPSFIQLNYPPYWHYDVLQALLVLHRAGYGGDPRTDRARDVVAGQRRTDGLWRARRRWWRPPGATGGGVEAFDWGDVGNQMVTLNALRVGAERLLSAAQS